MLFCDSLEVADPRVAAMLAKPQIADYYPTMPMVRVSSSFWAMNTWAEGSTVLVNGSGLRTAHIMRWHSLSLGNILTQYLKSCNECYLKFLTGGSLQCGRLLVSGSSGGGGGAGGALELSVLLTRQPFKVAAESHDPFSFLLESTAQVLMKNMLH